MSNHKSIPVNLHILDKDYVVACPEEERDLLLAAAQYLNQKIQQTRIGGKVASNERLVVISALNIIHEYFQYKQQREVDFETLHVKIAYLQEKIELALSKIRE